MDVGQCSSGRTCGSNELCQAVDLDIKTIASPDGQSTHTYSVMWSLVMCHVIMVISGDVATAILSCNCHMMCVLVSCDRHAGL